MKHKGVTRTPPSRSETLVDDGNCSGANTYAKAAQSLCIEAQHERAMSKWPIFLSLLLVLSGRADAALAQLAVTIAPDKAEYALREPVRLSVRFENVGSAPLRIVPAAFLGSSMLFTFYEVTEPDSTVVDRKLQYAFPDFATNQILGESLDPSEYIEFVMYPNLTTSLPGEAVYRRGFTFAKTGKYVLRFGYHVPRLFTGVWQSPDDLPVLSNEVTINVRLASAEETEILDAYWSASRSDLACGDQAVYIKIDESRTRIVLAKYADYALSDHLRYNLARGLLTRDEGSDEAVQIFETLRERQFNRQVICSCLGAVYARRGDQERARAVLYSALRDQPTLLHDHAFMTRVIMVETDSHEKLVEWEMECARGERLHFAGVELPKDIRNKVPNAK